MEQKTLITILVSVLVLALGAWAVSAFWFSTTTIEPVEVETEPNAADREQEDERFSNIERIEALQFYDDGVHTFVGEIDLPTPCDLLNTEAVVRESFPEQIELQFTVINEDADVCAQVITPQRFMVEVPASAEATVSAQFMGRPVELNLREPQPGETPDDFELFIKG